MSSETISRFGHKLIVLNGFTFGYQKELKSSGMARWTCTKRNCLSSIKTISKEDTTIIESKEIHNHSQIAESKLHVQKTRGELKQDDERPAEIIFHQLQSSPAPVDKDTAELGLVVDYRQRTEMCEYENEDTAEFVKKITSLELSLIKMKKENVSLINANLDLTLELGHLKQAVINLNSLLSSALGSLGEAKSTVLELKTNKSLSSPKTPEKSLQFVQSDGLLRCGLSSQQLYTIQKLTREREVYLSPILEVETPRKTPVLHRFANTLRPSYFSIHEISRKSPKEENPQTFSPTNHTSDESPENFFGTKKTRSYRDQKNSAKSDLPLKYRLRHQVNKSYRDCFPSPEKAQKARSKKRTKKTNEGDKKETGQA